tara:strand:- start:273 stop:785 length:513 start_codon:yes stop_codon:yes gene_type:complete
MIKIYIAGTSDKVIDVERELDKYGIDYFSPRKIGMMAHISPEGRTDESKIIYNKKAEEMLTCNVLLAVLDGNDTEAVYDAGYWMALKDHFKYKSDVSADEFQRYLVTANFGDVYFSPFLEGLADANLNEASGMMNFCGIVAGNWDAPAGKENNTEWQNNSIRRRKILNQF